MNIDILILYLSLCEDIVYKIDLDLHSIFYAKY